MTEKLYDIDSHQIEFTATVEDSYESENGFITILDRTAFFPEGGGQLSDIGTINDANVLDVQINGDDIYHYTSRLLEKGETVTGVIDWNRRFDFMQQHSGEHIVSGVAHKLFGCENVGFHLSTDIVTLDFDKPLNREQILVIEAKANEAIFNNSKIITYYPDKETLNSLVYRSKKEIEGAVRIVEIEGVDACACCAPHVNTAAEIGIIKLLDSEKLRGGVRIEMKCGYRALADYNQKYDNLRKISGLLAIKQHEAADGVERLMGNLSELKFKLTALKKQIMDSKIAEFKNTADKTCVFEEDLEIKELQIFADSLYKLHGGIRGVFSGKDNEYCFAICGDANELDAYFKEFKTKFTVRGGGRNGMVQGTVFASQEEILGVFNELD